MKKYIVTLSRPTAARPGRCGCRPTSSSSWGRPRDLRRDGATLFGKGELKPRLREPWGIPPEANAEFVAAMEDVLDVYHRPHDERRPLVRLDEASERLVGEVVKPIAAEPGQPERYDYEHTRDGAADLFMIPMPLLGWRAVHVTERRTAVDFAEGFRWPIEEMHEEAKRVAPVMDDLSTHKLASLYEASPPERARRVA